jgi:hypothetical protein
MKLQGVRGAIITTEMDPRLPDQKEMSGLLTEAGIDHQFVITPNIGHWYPDDLEARIDEAVEFILQFER